MTIHQCGDSDLDPMNCPACNSGDRPMSGDTLSKALAVMARIEKGLCMDCDRPVGDSERALCPLCRGEVSELLDDLDAFEEGR